VCRSVGRRHRDGWNGIAITNPVNGQTSFIASAIFLIGWRGVPGTTHFAVMRAGQVCEQIKARLIEMDDVLLGQSWGIDGC
jgi:hypothetical protein